MGRRRRRHGLGLALGSAKQSRTCERDHRFAHIGGVPGWLVLVAHRQATSSLKRRTRRTRRRSAQVPRADVGDRPLTLHNKNRRNLCADELGSHRLLYAAHGMDASIPDTPRGFQGGARACVRRIVREHPTNAAPLQRAPARAHLRQPHRPTTCRPQAAVTKGE